MRTISNAQLASAARLAMLDGTLAAVLPAPSLCVWREFGTVCAVGASLTEQEVSLLYNNCLTGPADLYALPADSGFAFEDARYAVKLGMAHDRWVRSFRDPLETREKCRAEFLRLLDLHDPVRKLEREAKLRELVTTP